MNKKELLYYWDAVKSITDVIKKKADKNHFGEKYATSYDVEKIGCDEVAIYNTEKETVIAINGSDGDKEEWRSNFNGYPVIDGCHYNFRKDGIRILERVVRDCPKHKPILVVGHSRGGALAQIFSHYLFALHGRKAIAVTYGSPRPFSVRKCRSLSFFHVRVHTDGDIVCHTPAVWMPPFFKSYDTRSVRIGPRKILGLKKKHGEYGEMIEKYLK